MRLMYINGEFTKGSASGEIEVTNPAIEEVMDTVPQGTAEDVEAAVLSSMEGKLSRRAEGSELLPAVEAQVRLGNS